MSEGWVDICMVKQEKSRKQGRSSDMAMSLMCSRDRKVTLTTAKRDEVAEVAVVESQKALESQKGLVFLKLHWEIWKLLAGEGQPEQCFRKEQFWLLCTEQSKCGSSWTKSCYRKNYRIVLSETGIGKKCLLFLFIIFHFLFKFLFKSDILVSFTNDLIYLSDGKKWIINDQVISFE